MTVNGRALPANSSVVIPRLVCKKVEEEVEFCTRVFDAVELGRRCGPDGGVVHALMKIGPAMIMIEWEWPTLPSRAPTLDGDSPVVIFVYVENVDATVERGLAHGARLLIPPEDRFWGDRTAWIMDPAGHVWTIATRIEEPTEAQRQERWASTLAELRGT